MPFLNNLLKLLKSAKGAESAALKGGLHPELISPEIRALRETGAVSPKMAELEAALQKRTSSPIDESTPDIKKFLELSKRSEQEANAAKEALELKKSASSDPTKTLPIEDVPVKDVSEAPVKEVYEEFLDKHPDLAGYLQDAPISSLGKKAAAIGGTALLGSGASALMPEDAEAGVPGSKKAMQAIKEAPGLANDFSNWLFGANRVARDKLANVDLPKEARMEMLRRLAPQTQYRRNPQTGEVEYLLHRGGGGYTGPEARSWTTDPNVAETFAADQPVGKDVIQKAWVPQSQIKNYPNMFGGVSATGSDVGGSSRFLRESNPLKSEQEVLAQVHPENITETTKLRPETHKIDDAEIDEFFKGHKAAGLGGAALGAAIASPKKAEAGLLPNPYEGFDKNSLFYKDIPEQYQRQEVEEPALDPIDFIPTPGIGLSKFGKLGKLLGK